MSNVGVKNMTTGETIQNKRKQFGWSQDQLAEKLNISRQSISKWEQDLALPDLENGLKLCKTLGITVEELLQPSNNTQPRNNSPENSFQSAQKFIRKSWHFSGLYLVMIGVLIVVAGYLFQMITQAMSNQASSWGEMFGGFPNMFPVINTNNIFNSLIGLSLYVGVFIIIIGCGIFIYGRFVNKHKSFL